MTRSQLNLAVDRTAAAVSKLDFSNEKLYAAWLAQAYFFVRHSVPLLKVSHARSAHDPSYHERSGEHVKEETGHEKMLLRDLKSLGHSIESFKELDSTKALYQTQYYWLTQVSHLSLLGYIVILEGLAVRVGKQKYAEVANPKAATFLKLHVEEDVDHLEQAFEQIEALDEKSRAIVIENALESAYLYERMIDQIIDANRSAREQAA